METLGLPINLLWSGVFLLIGFVYVSDRRASLNRCDKIEKMIDESKKQLSKDEFRELENTIKQEVVHVLDSKVFRKDLKEVIRDVLLHCNRTSEIQMLAMVESIDRLSQNVQNLSIKVNSNENHLPVRSRTKTKS